VPKLLSGSAFLYGDGASSWIEKGEGSKRNTFTMEEKLLFLYAQKKEDRSTHRKGIGDSENRKGKVPLKGGSASQKGNGQIHCEGKRDEFPRKL